MGCFPLSMHATLLDASAALECSFQLKHGSYEVNPPFVPALLTAAAERVGALLQVGGVGWRPGS